ncbi:uncharacterized protein [Rutidosis leptorrhynchoides]|uniref:uncharacterized protein n=1 Tax=Rutidosis leptorrhynchoides TaxID=125765 RepID=UPI003A9A3D72
MHGSELTWPSTWYTEFNAIQDVAPPILTDQSDIVQWRDCSGNWIDFSVSVVWDTIRPHAPTIPWCSVIWYSQCIPRHAFIVWLLMGERLKTQDKLKACERNLQLNVNLTCALCKSQPDSHDHLFFYCPVSKQLCKKFTHVVAVANWSSDWKNLREILIPYANRNVARGVVAKLVFGALVYYVWQERNNRLYGQRLVRWTSSMKLPSQQFE